MPQDDLLGEPLRYGHARRLVQMLLELVDLVGERCASGTDTGVFDQIGARGVRHSQLCAAKGQTFDLLTPCMCLLLLAALTIRRSAWRARHSRVMTFCSVMPIMPAISLPLNPPSTCSISGALYR